MPRFRFPLLLAAALAGAGPALAADIPVDLELVLAVDISGSIDPDEAALQRRGYVEVLASPEVMDAIRSGTMGRIAVAYVEWAGPDNQSVVLPWQEIGDEAAARAFANALAEAPLNSARWTAVGAAIDFAVPLFENNGFEGMRRVIDISGDGYTNRGRPAAQARDAAVAAGITINGLPILNDRPNPWGGPPTVGLDAYFESDVIGGPGAFSIPAQDFGDFGRAILAKLIREIAALERGAG